MHVWKSPTVWNPSKANRKTLIVVQLFQIQITDTEIGWKVLIYLNNSLIVTLDADLNFKIEIIWHELYLENTSITIDPDYSWKKNNIILAYIHIIASECIKIDSIH